jgi:hypothetical protein
MNPTLYGTLIALGVLLGMSIALTLTIEGAGALYLRDQLRRLLERYPSPSGSPTRTPSTGAAQEPAPPEDARELVLR